MLLGLKVAQAEIQRIPGKGQITSVVLRLCRIRIGQALLLSKDVNALGGVVVVAPVISRAGGKTRQHLRQRQIELTLLQCDLGLGELRIVVVLERAGDCLGKAQRTIERNIRGIDDLAVGLGANDVLLQRHWLRPQAATAGEHEKCHYGDQRKTRDPGEHQ